VEKNTFWIYDMFFSWSQNFKELFVCFGLKLSLDLMIYITDPSISPTLSSKPEILSSASFSVLLWIISQLLVYSLCFYFYQFDSLALSSSFLSLLRSIFISWIVFVISTNWFFSLFIKTFIHIIFNAFQIHVYISIYMCQFAYTYKCI